LIREQQHSQWPSASESRLSLSHATKRSSKIIAACTVVCICAIASLAWIGWHWISPASKQEID
jgi:TRAP-type C4-dicarboxylate transport system permease small subunit